MWRALLRRLGSGPGRRSVRTAGGSLPSPGERKGRRPPLTGAPPPAVRVRPRPDGEPAPPTEADTGLHARRRGSSPAAPTTGGKVGVRLRETVAARLLELRESFAGTGGRWDHEALLDSLDGNGSPMVRQLPLAARQLLRASRRAEVSVRDLTRIVTKDPALLQSLLRHANSAFYAMAPGGRPIMSVPLALQRIGARGVEIVVTWHLVQGVLCRPGDGLNGMVEVVLTEEPAPEPTPPA